MRLAITNVKKTNLRGANRIDGQRWRAPAALSALQEWLVKVFVLSDAPGWIPSVFFRLWLRYMPVTGGVVREASVLRDTVKRFDGRLALKSEVAIAGFIQVNQEVEVLHQEGLTVAQL